VHTLAALWQCDAGASAAEYGLILAIVGTTLAVGSVLLGGVIADSMSDAAACIEDAADC
jgi:pilus assembly protein Flp/PilA